MMKYASPEYEKTVVETEDIVTASNYEVKQNNDGSGTVLMNIFDL